MIRFISHVYDQPPSNTVSIPCIETKFPHMGYEYIIKTMTVYLTP